MRHAILPFCILLGACAPSNSGDVPSRAATPRASAMPEMKAFPPTRPAKPQRANQDIARDFLDLTFKLESGRVLERFTRFEEPISIRVTGAPPPTLIPDLERLLKRLRKEAQIDIRRTAQEPANITVEAVSRARIRQHLPKAACFVVPNISSLSEYRRLRHSRHTSWSKLSQRRRLAIFIPNDTSPQEVRDCLHEELAQALGPLNDLYRLPDSVFNDDNVHTVLTGFDMLVLRAFYAPELRNGMTRAQVARRLPAILARLNPAGERKAASAPRSTSRDWIDAIQKALGPGARQAERLLAALDALRIARASGWQDHRLAFSHFALGRLTQSTDPDLARDQFVVAQKLYKNSPGTELHQAHAASQLAAHAIREGRGKHALTLLEPHLATAKRHENAALLATLMMLKAEALELDGRVAAARTVRLDSLGWARYGFGADWAVRAKLREIAMLNPRRGPNG
ncbi:DUF2927 domain-containing protein [Roseovarius sp. SYSU LYC5161]|uniref:DUF2927 domain-containing protein n=1 Tax=Roseovarius halophilus (ex Wu et al. 2025) TaxID=3376060 RepID=UPI0028717C09|nr:DUF2927 domain-containing protein [Roseovarius sp.]